MSGEHLSLRAEADRVQAATLRSQHEGRLLLAGLLDRPKRLAGEEKRLALDFNARLVGELRQRRVAIWGDA